MLQSAAAGNYAQAQADLRTIRAELDVGRAMMQKQALAFAGRFWLYLPPLFSNSAPFLPTVGTLALKQALNERERIEVSESALRAQQADLCVLEGLLALEQGDTAAARAVFAQAQELGAPGSSPTAVSPACTPISTLYFGKLKSQE